MTTPSLRVSGLFVALLLAGCGGSSTPPTPPPAPTVVTFSASPGTLTSPGGDVTLSWTCENATGISIEQVGAGPVPGATTASGTATVNVTADTVFILTARGEGGTDARAVGVQVGAAPAAPLFVAVPPSVRAGEATTLTWFARGATTVTLTDAAGQPVDTRGQVEAGAVTVTPDTSTSWTLTVDGKAVTTSVRVTPSIEAFALDGPAPLPGGGAKLAWRTRGATSVTVTRAGLATPLVDEMDPAKVAQGDVTDAVPANLPLRGVLTYTLEARAGAEVVTRQLVVTLAGALRFTSSTIPSVGRPGGTTAVAWKTVGADNVVVSVDGRPVYFSGVPAEVAAGTAAVDVLPRPQVITITATNRAGEQAEVSGTLEEVGPVSFVSFTAAPTALGQGGGAVTLSWNVPNARHVRLTQVGGGLTVERTGKLDTGTLVVRPNQAMVSYQLEADNQLGDAIAARFATVKVASPALVTVSRKLPAGGATTVTGTTATGALSVLGLPSVALNVAGEAFVDIASTGTEVSEFLADYGSGVPAPSPDNGSAHVTVPGMDLRLYGRHVDSTRLLINVNGWLAFTTDDTWAIPSVPVGTSLMPLALVPLGADLDLTNRGRVHWRQDVSGGVDRLIVQWTDVEVHGQPGTRATFQAQLYATGRVVFAYRDVQVGSTAYSAAVVAPPGSTALTPTRAPVAGDAVTFFRPVPVADLPLAHTIQPAPYWAGIETAAGPFEARLDDALLSGDLGITEANVRPALGLTNAEWIELLNTSDGPIDLQGWTLVAGASSHTIATALVVPPHSRVLLAQALGLGDGATVTVDYVYPSSFTLPDASGQLELRLPGATTAFTRFNWNSSTAPTNGTAVQADPPNAGFRVPPPYLTPTCTAAGTTTYGTSLQRGTPRQAQAKCFPYVLEPLPPAGFQPIASTGTRLVASSHPDSSGSTYQVFLSRPVSYFGASANLVSVCTNGWLSTSPTTSTAASAKTLPSSAVPVGAVAPYWTPLTGQGGVPTNGLYWQQRDPDGIAGTGDEETLFSWEGFRLNDALFAAESIDFQVKFLASGDLEFHYGAATDLMRGGTATSWIENRIGTMALAVNVQSLDPGIRPFTSFRYRYEP